MSDIEQAIATCLPAARNGNRQAFERLVAATQNMVTSLALAVVRDIQHSEDIAQEAYLTVWKRLKTLRNANSFLPWLRQITRNLARDHLRRQRSRPGDQAGYDDGAEMLDRSGRVNHSEEQSALDDEQDRLIREALESMPSESREVLTLFYREGQSSQQVARLLGLSDAAVRKRLSRARDALREEIELRLGESLARTVPGVAFTALVGSLLMTASPPAAAAMVIAAGVKTGAKALLGASAGMLLALVGGIAGVILGLREPIRTSTDQQELKELKRLRTAGIITVVLAVGGFGLSAILPGWLPAVLVFVLFISAIAVQHLVVLPRILEPRLAALRQDNPEEERRQWRRRIVAWTGMVAGTIMATGGLLFGLLAAGRIG